MWRAIGHSVRGASHRRSGQPNQDAIAWVPLTGCEIALAVADGHGSAPSFRSDVGSRLAVECATSLVREFLHTHADHDFIELRRAAVEWLPLELVRRWRSAVSEHLRGHPFSAKTNGEFVAYGSTILCVAVTAAFVLYLQLGDGDILVVSGDRRVQRPWQRDERLLGVETTSLCTSTAAADMRISLRPVSTSSPQLVLLCSDGYANSFREDRGFLRVGQDILDMIRADGIDAVNGSLEEWLDEASRLGSGDDITLGILHKTDA